MTCSQDPMQTIVIKSEPRYMGRNKTKKLQLQHYEEQTLVKNIAGDL